jgi:hypothetical protein
MGTTVEGSPSAKEPQSGEQTLAETDRNVLFRARVTPVMLAVNVVVGIALCTGIGAFLGHFILDRLWLMTGIGFLLGFSGLRSRKEPDEILPATLERGDEPNVVLCTFFRGPTLLWTPAQMAHVDAEATGSSREGFVHWVVLRNKLVPPEVTKIRAQSRKQAVELAHVLREILEVKPLHELGDDEPNGANETRSVAQLDAPKVAAIEAPVVAETKVVAEAQAAEQPADAKDISLPATTASSVANPVTTDSD